MARKKRALITGISGQDGSYLADHLLELGNYEVHGVKRRTSLLNTDRIDHILDKITLHYGELTDALNLAKLISDIRPDEIYNLAAQSHVAVSFQTPGFTADTNALGTQYILEAIRLLYKEEDEQPRFYQASSSELFGKVVETPQNENTPFYPRSPYAAAKQYAYWITRNYREGYDMFAVNGILFNHECIAATTPLIIKHGNFIDIVTPRDLVGLLGKGANQQTFDIAGVQVWDGEQWTNLNCITATKRHPQLINHIERSIETRGGIVSTTGHHTMLSETFETKRADTLVVGENLALGSMPAPVSFTTVSDDFAELLGFLAADGYVAEEEHSTIQFTNNFEVLCTRVAELWETLFCGTWRLSSSPSGFNEGTTVTQLYLKGVSGIAGWLRSLLYTKRKFKRVPAIILNAPVSTQQAFLRGYYAGDGLKAGNGDSVKTNSAILAQGLVWLYRCAGRACSVYAEHRGEATYYQLNIRTDSPNGGKGQHLVKDPATIRVIHKNEYPSEWVFDLATESGHFCAGVGRLIVHNSPRRGETFVTRKIAKAVANIQAGNQKHLVLGNLEAKRDWGHAKDYVRGMHLMLQHHEPEDFVLATGEQHSVRDFCTLAFEIAGMPIQWVKSVGYLRGTNEQVVIGEVAKYERPTEVESLLGDASKAKRILGWAPQISFRELVREMVEHETAATTRG